MHAFAPQTPLTPDREQLELFIRTLFKHATVKRYYFSLRIFHDDASRTARIRPLRVSLDTLIERAVLNAEWAANASAKLVFAPPVALFGNPDHAKEADLAEGPVLSVELDKAAPAARFKLELLLGAATIVVASGGFSIDETTGEVEPKLHLHFRLKVPARGKEELIKLKELRRLATKLAGGDASNVPAVHPIRWPGSWHRKGEPKLCRIVACNPDAEIELDQALAILREFAGDETADTEGKQPKAGTEPSNWSELIGQVLSTESYHGPLNQLAAKLIKGGLDQGAAVNMLRGLMLNVDGPHDERWQARFDDIARAVATAAKFKVDPKVEFAEFFVKDNATKTARPVFDPWARFVVPRFPLDVLPPIVREFAVSQADVIGVDEASMAMCALANLSGALSHSFRLKMMRHGTWFVSPRLWLLLFGDASTKKTPAFDTATAALEQYQMELQQDYKRKLDAYELVCLTADKNSKPIKPNPPIRLVIWDTTIEKLGELLARGERGLLVKRDEFAGWIGAMEKYGGNAKGGLANRAFWLKAYDGGAYAVDRVGRGEIFVDNLSVSLIGGVQPERLAELHGLTSDGLLQRFIPVVMGLARLPVDRPGDIGAYDRLVRDLIEAEAGDLAFDDPALAVMGELRRHLHELAGHAGGLARGFQSFLGKLQGVAGTLALILHMAADPKGGVSKPVGENTAEAVRKLVLDFILPHALEFYRSAESATDGDRLKRLASWILTSRKLRFVVSDLTSNVSDFRGLSLFEVNERVSPLRAAGWIAAEDTRLGPQNRAWVVNPVVFTQFAARGEEEEAIKAKLAELMNSPRRRRA